MPKLSERTGSLLRRSVVLLQNERLHPMVLEETPQGVPDGGLVVYVEPLLDEEVQSLHVSSGQSNAETPLFQPLHSLIYLLVSIVGGKQLKSFPIFPMSRCTRLEMMTLGSAKVSTKGQVTIPVDARQKFNIEIGDIILFLEENGKLVLRRG